MCDMQCLGADGLARFFEEFNNVTNTLMGSSESYEMSVLDIVLPCHIMGKVSNMLQLFLPL